MGCSLTVRSREVINNLILLDMTIQDYIRRLKRYWWVVTGTTLAFFLILFPWITTPQYAGSISVGINFNNPTLSTKEQSQQAYVESFQQLTIYLEQRFTSIEVQSGIARRMNKSVSNINSRRAFYDLTSQGAGFVSLAYTTPDKDEAARYIEAVKEEYRVIINEWNNQRLDEFRITPQDSFVSQVTAVTPPQQFRLFSVIGGLLIGLFITAFLPLGSKK